MEKFSNLVIKDLYYCKGLYSNATAYLANEIKRVLDAYDYPHSFIYDEYPDKVTLKHITDQIVIQIKMPETELWLKPLLEVLIFQDIILRRYIRFLTTQQKEVKADTAVINNSDTAVFNNADTAVFNNADTAVFNNADTSSI